MSVAMGKTDRLAWEIKPKQRKEKKKAINVNAVIRLKPTQHRSRKKSEEKSNKRQGKEERKQMKEHWP